MLTSAQPESAVPKKTINNFIILCKKFIANVGTSTTCTALHGVNYIGSAVNIFFIFNLFYLFLISFCSLLQYTVVDHSSHVFKFHHAFWVTFAKHSLFVQILQMSIHLLFCMNLCPYQKNIWSIDQHDIWSN